MSIILAAITGGIRCGYSSTGPTKQQPKMGEVGEGVKWGGGGGEVGGGELGGGVL